MAEVRICETTAVDKILWTINKFERERVISQMPWSEARFNFTNCLGEIPQERLVRVCTRYQEENGREYANTQNGFNRMIKDYIRDLCKDEDAKSTLKREVFNGLWSKPMDK